MKVELTAVYRKVSEGYIGPGRHSRAPSHYRRVKRVELIRHLEAET